MTVLGRPGRRKAGRHRLPLRAAVVALATLPLVMALTDVYLAAAPAALIASTATGALAVSALAAQPFLAARSRTADAALARRRLGWHRLLGLVALSLVVLHVGALFAVEVEHTLFTLSPDGPTRARMAVIALAALIAAATLGVTRRSLPISTTTWRILHAYLASVAIVLGIGHAVLTDGALDGLGTPVLILFGVAGLAGVVYANLTRPTRARRADGAAGAVGMR